MTMPGSGEPLHDWQAVVIGGGIINGLSSRGHWPAERVAEIFGADKTLNDRWERTVNLAATMADDAKVPSGTRYDALRMLGVESWEKRGAHLQKYLVKGINDELQQGAISGISDIRSPRVAPALVAGLSHFSKSNQELALEALMREDQRIEVLLDEIEAGRITKTALTSQRIDRLKNVKTEALARRARVVGLK
jgi:hypothetical protein